MTTTITNEHEETIEHLLETCPDSTGFMPVVDATGGVYWIIADDPDHPEILKLLGGGGFTCYHGGTLEEAECGHLTCNDSHQPDAKCDIAKEEAKLILKGRYTGPWEDSYPDEWQSSCAACAAPYEPDYDDWDR